MITANAVLAFSGVDSSIVGVHVPSGKTRHPSKVDVLTLSKIPTLHVERFRIVQGDLLKEYRVRFLETFGNRQIEAQHWSFVVLV